MIGIITAVLFLLCGFSSPLQAAVKGEEIEYKSGDTVMKGYLAYDDSISGKRPGVLVVHEWWGHNEYARERARMLAELGYTALAVDMYGDGKQASHPEDAGKFAGEVRKNMPEAESRFNAAKDILKKHKTTNPDKIAAIGYCFGGGLLLELARRGIELNGIVSFHGSLATENPATVGSVKTKVLVCHGADDPFVKPEHIAAVKSEMKDAKATFTFKEYAGAKHSFTNPGANEFGKKFNLPLEYNEQADKQSWEDMKEFLQAAFK
ncbi:MAG: dienelactone hydrolase [Gammaproteobacteria bacterium SG8_11]|nr:MAG: dienelactone hydrolase [Gammaproteobacteria bacterium SG8_11]